MIASCRYRQSSRSSVRAQRRRLCKRRFKRVQQGNRIELEYARIIADKSSHKHRTRQIRITVGFERLHLAWGNSHLRSHVRHAKSCGFTRAPQR
jgi:hypothetical protein